MHEHDSSRTQSFVDEVSRPFSLANHLFLQVIPKVKVDVLDSLRLKVVWQLLGSINDMSDFAMIQQLSLVLTAVLVAKIEPLNDEVYMRVAMSLHGRLQYRLFAPVALHVVLHGF